MAVSIMAGIPALKELNSDLRRRMDQAVATFQASLASTRTGRASVHMLDQVKVDYYGTPTPINQLAQVSAPEAQLILISPWDPTILKEIEKAIQSRRSRLQSHLRRQGHPRPRSAHDRGAPPRGLSSTSTRFSKSTAPRSATSAATATTPSRSSPRKRRSARTRRSAPSKKCRR